MQHCKIRLVYTLIAMPVPSRIRNGRFKRLISDHRTEREVRCPLILLNISCIVSKTVIDIYKNVNYFDKIKVTRLHFFFNAKT